MSTQITISDFSTGGSISTEDVARKKQARVTETGQRSHETSSEISINQEIIPVFAEVSTKLLRFKLYSWLKTTKDLIQQLNTGPQSVFFQPINRACPVNFGFTVAIVREQHEQEQYHYVLNSYLAEWHISQSTLIPNSPSKPPQKTRRRRGEYLAQERDRNTVYSRPRSC